MASKPTLESIAAQVGVSRQTVSNVINAPDKVKASTRRRVQAAIDACGYRPSALARALRTRRSMQLGLRLRAVGDGVHDAVMDSFLHAVVEYAASRDHGCRLIVASDDEDEARQLSDLQRVAAIDGCILTDTTLGDPRPAMLRAERTPFVAFGRPWGAAEATHSWVDVDGRRGVCDAVGALMERGSERVGFIGWPGDEGPGPDRRKGWEDATADRTRNRERLLHLGEDTAEEGAAGARRLLEAGVDAIVCASDSLAIGALSQCRGSGTFMPIVGFDDTAVAREVGLSSLHQPMEEIARALVDVLLDTIEEPDRRPVQRLVRPRLAMRATPGYL